MRKSADDLNLSRCELDFLIEQWIFNEEHRRILRRRLFDGITFDQLAYENNLSVQHVKSIVYKAFDRLTKHI